MTSQSNRSEFDIRPSLARLCRELADWRRHRYEDDLRDRRNLVTSAALLEFADYVIALPTSDERLTELARISASGHDFIVGQQSLYELGRLRFHQPSTELDAFLDQLVEFARSDQGEQGRFGGQQVPGDDPWG